METPTMLQVPPAMPALTVPWSVPAAALSSSRYELSVDEQVELDSYLSIILDGYLHFGGNAFPRMMYIKLKKTVTTFLVSGPNVLRNCLCRNNAQQVQDLALDTVSTVGCSGGAGSQAYERRFATYSGKLKLLVSYIRDCFSGSWGDRDRIIRQRQSTCILGKEVFVSEEESKAVLGSLKQERTTGCACILLVFYTRDQEHRVCPRDRGMQLAQSVLS